MKNKLRAGMGIKNPMVMVDPDKAEEKFEKMATSITASTGEEEEKEGACESIDQKLSDISKEIMGFKKEEVRYPDSVRYGGNEHLRGLPKKPAKLNLPSKPDKPDKPSLPSPDVPSNDNTPSLPPKADTKPLPKPKPKPISVMSSYDPISNKDILGVTEKILKKNFNLGEEGYDIARDQGRVKPAKDKKDGTSYPQVKK